MSGGERTAAAIVVALSLASLGGLLDRRAWAFRLEVVRVVGLAGVTPLLAAPGVRWWRRRPAWPRWGGSSAAGTTATSLPARACARRLRRETNRRKIAPSRASIRATLEGWGMVTVCAWCQKYMGTKEPLGDPRHPRDLRHLRAPPAAREMPTLVIAREHAEALPIFQGLLTGVPKIPVVVDRRRANASEPPPVGEQIRAAPEQRTAARASAWFLV